MPRTLSTALQNEVASAQNKIATLVEINTANVIRATDFVRDLTFDSDTYVAGGSFLEIDNTEETGQLKVDEIQISLANVTDTVIDEIAAGNYYHRQVNVNLAFLDTDESIIGAINYFTGNIRSAAITETNKDSTINLVVASHWSNWQLTKGRHFSDESQQKFSSGDKGLEFATQNKDDIRWGVG